MNPNRRDLLPGLAPEGPAPLEGTTREAWVAEEPPVAPTLSEGMLDAPGLDALEADLLTHAQIHQVRCKGAPQANTGAQALPLSDALDALRAGTLFAVQVDYRFDATNWTDTILRTPTGARVVRCQLPALD